MALVLGLGGVFLFITLVGIIYILHSSNGRRGMGWNGQELGKGRGQDRYIRFIFGALCYVTVCVLLLLLMELEERGINNIFYGHT